MEIENNQKKAGRRYIFIKLSEKRTLLNTGDRIESLKN